MGNAYSILGGKPEQKGRRLGRTRRKKDSNIEIEVKELNDDVVWIRLTQEKVQRWNLVTKIINLPGSAKDG
jgi:hypothetical protein